MKKERNSNIELLRIVLMMGILISHFYPITLDENYVYYGASYIWFLGDFLGWTMTGFGKVGVMIFVLISGYFLCDMTFSKQKLYKFLFQCYFWNLIMLFVGLFVLKYSLKPSIIYEGLFPLTPNNWFARTYLMLYVSFPYINKWIVNRYNKKILRNIVLIGIGLLMVLPMLFRIAQGGYLNSYLVFILLYLVGAYLKRYPPKDEFLMKIGGVCLAVMLITNLCHAYQVVYNHTPHMFYGISDIYRSDNAPFALGMAVGIFTYFKRLTIAPNPYINKIASTTLAVYLIHANRVVFPHAFDLFKIAYFNQAPILILPYIVICSLVIFSICSILELLRVKYVETPLFQWLYETKK